jgi:nucleoside-diphosphate-sugar epimerase
VHLAQSREHRNFPEAAPDIFSVNVRSVIDLLEYARLAGARRFVLASTGSVYGTGPRPFFETDPPNPAGFYPASKYSAELLAGCYRPEFDVVTLRFFCLYGPGQRQMLIANLVSKVLAGERVSITGNPGMRLNPTFVEDAARCLAAAVDLEGSATINVAGDEVVSLTDLVGAIGRQARLSVDVCHVPGSSQDLIGDNARMKEVLRIHPATALAEGLARVIGHDPGRQRGG